MIPSRRIGTTYVNFCQRTSAKRRSARRQAAPWAQAAASASLLPSNGGRSKLTKVLNPKIQHSRRFELSGTLRPKGLTASESTRLAASAHGSVQGHAVVPQRNEFWTNRKPSAPKYLELRWDLEQGSGRRE